MSKQIYRVFPGADGWEIEVDGHRRGPYRNETAALQLVLAHAHIGRARGRTAEIVIEEGNATQTSMTLGHFGGHLGCALT